MKNHWFGKEVATHRQKVPPRAAGHSNSAGRVIGFILSMATLAASAVAETSHPQPRASVCELPTLTTANVPEDAGFSAEGLAKVDQLIQRDIAAGFPGAALIVIKDGQIVKRSAYGYSKKFSGNTPLPQFQKTQNDTLFDLASNTKMYATNFALQKLVSEGQLNLDGKIQQYLPKFRDSDEDTIKGKANLRVVDLLQHSAGFAPDPQFHNPAVSRELFSQDRDKTTEFLNRVPLSYTPGSKTAYSDTDYMLLGAIIERVTGQPLDAYVENEIYRPLNLKHTLFNPLAKGVTADSIAATELMGNTRDGVIHFPGIRTHTLQGEVHDEKAFYSMAGVSGHAGLFSTTGDLAILLQVMLNGGGYGTVCLFDQQTINTFTTPSPGNATFGLGWRRNTTPDMHWMFGTKASNRAYGHTGWTGTLTVIDPEISLGIVLLTNKKHSPLIAPASNSNKFAGDQFITGKYGGIVSAIYNALEPSELATEISPDKLVEHKQGSSLPASLP